MDAFVLLRSFLFSPMVFYCFDYLLLHFRLLQSISIFNVFWFPVFTLFLFLDLFTTCFHWLIIYTHLPFVMFGFSIRVYLRCLGMSPQGPRGSVGGHLVNPGAAAASRNYSGTTVEVSYRTR